MRVPEDGDELVRVDLRLDSAERGVAAFVCKRGAHCEAKGKGGYTFQMDGRDRREGGELTLYETYIAMNLRERELAWFHRDRRGW